MPADERKQYEELSTAIKKFDVAELKRLIEKEKYSPNAKVHFLRGKELSTATPLSAAVYALNPADKPADKAAIEKKRLEIIAYLLDKGVNLQDPEEGNTDVLERNNSLEVAELIVKKLPDDEARKAMIDASNGLWEAAYHRNKELFRYYLKNGADPVKNLRWVSVSDNFGDYKERMDALTPKQKNEVFAKPELIHAFSRHMEYPGEGMSKILADILPRLPKGHINALDTSMQTLLDKANAKANALNDERYPSDSDKKAIEAIIGVLKSNGAEPGEVVIAREATAAPSLLAFLEPQRGRLLAESPSQPDKQDFAEVPTLPARPNRGPVTHVFVVEDKTLLDGPEASRLHHRRTSYVANGVLCKLLGEREGKDCVVPVLGHSTDQFADIRGAIKAAQARGAQVVISHSIGGQQVNLLTGKPELRIPPDPPEVSTKPNSYKPVVSLPDNITIFHSAGNSGAKALHFQDHGQDMHPPNLISVGASRGGHPEYYSQYGAMFTASPLQENGYRLDGTSFAAPHAAAAYAALNRRYGQWKENPKGLTPQELRWIMANSAKRPPKDANKVPRPDGRSFDKKAGFGEMDILAADKLASELYDMKARAMPYGMPEIGPLKEHYKIVVPKKQQPDPVTGKYHTSITVNSSQVVDNILVEVKFKPPEKDGHIDNYYNGHIRIQGTDIPFNFSNSGESTIAGLNGMLLRSGTELTIITDVPVEEGVVRLRSTPAGYYYGINTIQRFQEGGSEGSNIVFSPTMTGAVGPFPGSLPPLKKETASPGKPPQK